MLFPGHSCGHLLAMGRMFNRRGVVRFCFFWCWRCVRGGYLVLRPCRFCGIPVRLSLRDKRWTGLKWREMRHEPDQVVVTGGVAGWSVVRGGCVSDVYFICHDD